MLDSLGLSPPQGASHLGQRRRLTGATPGYDYRPQDRRLRPSRFQLYDATIPNHSGQTGQRRERHHGHIAANGLRYLYAVVPSKFRIVHKKLLSTAETGVLAIAFPITFGPISTAT